MPNPTIWWAGTWQHSSGHQLVTKAGRQRHLSVEQAQALLRAAADGPPGGDPHPLHAYVFLLLTTGPARRVGGAVPAWQPIDLLGSLTCRWRWAHGRLPRLSLSNSRPSPQWRSFQRFLV